MCVCVRVSSISNRRQVQCTHFADMYNLLIAHIWKWVHRTCHRLIKYCIWKYAHTHIHIYIYIYIYCIHTQYIYIYACGIVSTGRGKGNQISGFLLLSSSALSFSPCPCYRADTKLKISCVESIKKVSINNRIFKMQKKNKNIQCACFFFSASRVNIYIYMCVSCFQKKIFIGFYRRINVRVRVFTALIEFFKMQKKNKKYPVLHEWIYIHVRVAFSKIFHRLYKRINVCMRVFTALYV